MSKHILQRKLKLKIYTSYKTIILEYISTGILPAIWVVIFSCRINFKDELSTFLSYFLIRLSIEQMLKAYTKSFCANG